MKPVMFNPIEEIIADLAEGKMVIIVDDEDRENEGDFLMVSSNQLYAGENLFEVIDCF